MISTVYCTRHDQLEEMASVEKVHRFEVQELGRDGEAHPNGDWAVEIQGTLTCGKAVHFIGSLYWTARR